MRTKGIIIAKKNERRIQIIEASASNVETIGFPNPPVIPVDTALVATVPSWITPAVLPPAIVAKIH